MRWFVDDGPFNTLADLADPRRLIASLQPGSLVLAPATKDAATESEARAALLASRTAQGRELFSSFQIVLDGKDPAGEIFLELHGKEFTTNDRAERESIAWMLAHEADGVFVTGDKQAAVTALAELGRARVAHPFDLWIYLLKNDSVTGVEFQALCERSKGLDQRLTRMPDRAARHFPSAAGG